MSVFDGDWDFWAIKSKCRKRREENSDSCLVGDVSGGGKGREKKKKKRERLEFSCSMVVWFSKNESS